MRYLSPPIRAPFTITEGWVYSDEEKRIHGHTLHAGIDFACPRGTPVQAAADGWAVASYSLSPLYDKQTGKRRRFKGKIVHFGLGNFVQIFHPETKRYTQYGHLEKVAEAIRFVRPRKTLDGRLLPTGHKMKPTDYPHYRFATWVKRGDVIGYVGDSGLGWGYADYPTRPDPKKFPSWDETHLHFEEFTRLTNGAKVQRDPFDLYTTAPAYRKALGKNHLWRRSPLS